MTELATALPHVQAFMALLEELPDWCSAKLGGRGKAVVDDTHSVVVVYPDPGTPETVSLIPDEGFAQYFTLHGIGSGPESAFDALDEARKLLVGARPVVAGRATWRIWQEPGGPPVNRDDDVKPPLYVAHAEFGMRSEAT